MPFTSPSYLPPFFLKNGHFNTIGGHLSRKQRTLPYQKRRIPTPDGDFLDLQLLISGNSRCALLIHGLEGSAESTYISSLAALLTSDGWDIAALNLRGCSGVPNLVYRSYNSGSTEDLHTVALHLILSYKEVALIGFSLGGNIVLKYMGEKSTSIPARIKAAIGISVPCHLSSSCDKLAGFQNTLYHHRFIQSLKGKLRQKMKLFPGRISEVSFQHIRSIRDFDDVYTAPSNGYIDAEDYYTHCSSLFVLDKIRVPTLLVNAGDDPFLSPLCFPTDIAKSNPHLHFLMPTYGGHVGFWPEKSSALWKHEEWVLEFLKGVDSNKITS